MIRRCVTNGLNSYVHDVTVATGQDVANLDELHGMWQDAYAEAMGRCENVVSSQGFD